MTGATTLLKRLLSERTLLVASCATVLFATAMLAALTGYGTSVTGEGLRRTLSHPAYSQVGVHVSGTVTGLDQADTRVRDALHQAFGHVPLDIGSNARGDSYVVPGQERLKHPQLTAFAYYAGIQGHATLVSGAWPTGSSGGAVEVAVCEPAAASMHLRTGQSVVLHSRINPDQSVNVRVSGIYRIRDSGDYFWAGDPLATTGTQRLDYTTFGPLVVTQQTFAERFANGTLTVNWLVRPDTSAVTSTELNGLAKRVSAMSAELTGTGSLAVSTQLPTLLQRLDSTVLVARSTMLVPLLQLVVLAGYALLLVARLISEHRRMEIALLRARGAGAFQLARLTVAEGLVLALPAAVLAPLLEPLPLKLVAQVPSIKSSGLRLQTSPSPTIWLIAVTTAVLCAVGLALPTLRGVATSYVASQAGRGRGERRGPLQRAGADVAVLLLAAIAIWQLVRYNGPTASGSSDFGGIDPVTVAAPTLALLGGGAVVLRLIPVISRTGERLTTGGRGFAPALAVRQLSRRPLRYAGPALLLVMAVAVGVISLSTATTWQDSQNGQADFQAGADLRVTPGTGLSALGEGARYAGLPGVTTASPVVTASAQVGDTDVSLFAADLHSFPDVLRSSAERVPGGLLSPEVTTTASVPGLESSGPGVTIPGTPKQITFRLRATGGTFRDGPATPSLVSANVVDGRGLARQIGLGTINSDGSTVTKLLTVSDLAGPGGALSYPLTIQGLRVDFVATLGMTPLTVSVLDITTDQGQSPRAPSAGAWAIGINSATGLIHQQNPAAGAGVFLSLTAKAAGLPDGFSDASPLQDDCSMTALLDVPQTPLPVAVTSALASKARVAPGTPLTLTLNGEQVSAKVVSIVKALPTSTPGQLGVMTDLSGLDLHFLGDGNEPPAPTEWWLAAGKGTAQARRTLAANPTWSTGIVDRTALRTQLRNAPLGAALPGALILGFAAALAFAVIGFAVNAAVTARERTREFAILHALGTSGRQMLGLVVVEQSILIVFGLLGGLVLGLVMSELVIPHIVLTVRATSPYPGVHLSVPWLSVAGLICGVTALLLAVLWILGRSLGGSLTPSGGGPAGRLGDER